MHETSNLYNLLVYELNNHFDNLKELTIFDSNVLFIKEINDMSIEFPSLEKLIINSSKIISIKMNSPKLNSISISRSKIIEIRGNIHSVQKLHFSSSEIIQIENIKYNKYTMKLKNY